MAWKRSFAIGSDRDAILTALEADIGDAEIAWSRPAASERPAAALLAVPPTPEDDVDRATEGIATGNVITGANTISGNAGKDHGGSGALSLSAAGTFALTYGEITLDTKGNYTYTRTTQFDALPEGAIETFNYALVDSKGNTSGAAALTLLLDPVITTPPTPPGSKSAVFNGTNYDEIIDSHTTTGPVSFPSTIAGLGGDDVIRNTINAHDVILSGGAGNDILIGGSGRDTLMGGPGADKLDGGAATNVASYATSTAGVVASLLTLLGTAGDALGDEFTNINGVIGGKGNDQLVGSDAANSLFGREGNDLLQGFGDDDSIGGQDGNDALFGGNGKDTLSGGTGNDELHGEAGNDKLNGGAGADFLDGGADTDTVDYSLSTKGILLDIDHSTKSTGDAKGDTFAAVEAISGTTFNDTLIAGATAVILHGDSGDDKVTGGVGDDPLFGDFGKDSLFGGDGSDNLDGGASEDVLDGGSGADTLLGGTEADVLRGGAGTDTLQGGAGDDLLVGGADADALDGGADTDAVSYADATSAVEFTLGASGVLGDALGDTYANIEIAVGSAFNDSIFGGNFNSTLFGGAGDDALFGGTFDDTLHGGAGFDLHDGGGGGTDTASYLGGKAVTVNLTDTLKSTGDAKGDSYILIDIIEGSGFADILIGDTDANTFNGDAGTDKMNGGAGGDRLNGDDGNDTLLGEGDGDILSGGAGADKLDGGSGDDVLYGNTSGLDFDLGKDTLLGGEGDDQLFGGSGDNKLDGGIGADQLQGGGGKDTLIGGIGDDVLIGGEGNDTLTGGAGVDRFTYGGTSGNGTDKVTDFNAAEDILHFTNVLNGSGDDIQDLAEAGYTAVSSGSTLTISQFGATAMIISGWKGGEVAGDIQTVALILGSHLDVH